MGVAFSDSAIAYQPLRTDDPDNFIDDLDEVLVGVGWVSTPVTGGFIYTLTSPQGLQARLQVRNLGDSVPFAGTYKYVTLQFLNMTGSVVGFEHKVTTGPGFSAEEYWVLAGICQVFIAILGNSTSTISGVPPDAHRTSFAGGIPYIPTPIGPECEASSGDAEVTTSIWWSSRRGGTPEQWQHIRTGRYCCNYFDFQRNGAVYIHNNSSSLDTPYTGTLQLYPLTMTEDVDFWFYTFPRIIRYGDDGYMKITPYLGWTFSIWGQLWDAFLATDVLPLESTVEYDETDVDTGGTRHTSWIAWNYYGASSTLLGGIGTMFATLCLLTGPPVYGGVGGGVGESNYVY